MLTDAQKKLRRTGIGSSDIATLCGLGPFRKNGQPFHDAMEIWCDKTGKAQDDGEGTPQQAQGHRLEPVIGRWYAEDRGVELFVLDGGTARHPKNDYMLATPDFVVRDEQGLVAEAIEVKNVGSRMAHDWRDGVPVYVTAQNLWQQGVLQIEKGVVTALVGGRDRVTEPVPFALDVLNAMIEVAHEFWEKYVVPDIPPPIDSSASWARYLSEKFPVAEGGMLEAPADAIGWAEQCLDYKDQIEVLKRQQTEAENHLKALVESNRGLFAPGWEATWTDRKGSIDWKAVAVRLWEGHQPDGFGGTLDHCKSLDEASERYRRKSTRTFACKRKETP